MKDLKKFDEKLREILEEAEYIDYGEENAVFHVSEAIDQIKQLISEVIGEEAVVLVDTKLRIIDNPNIEQAITIEQLRHAFNLKDS